MPKYDLEQMLAESILDEEAQPEKPKVLTQEDIQALIDAKRRKTP